MTMPSCSVSSVRCRAVNWSSCVIRSLRSRRTPQQLARVAARGQRHPTAGEAPRLRRKYGGKGGRRMCQAAHMYDDDCMSKSGAANIIRRPF